MAVHKKGYSCYNLQSICKYSTCTHTCMQAWASPGGVGMGGMAPPPPLWDLMAPPPPPPPPCRRPLTIKTYCPFPVTTHMRVMASNRKWSGAESRKSKRQRELLRSAEATAHIMTYFARTACSAVSTSKGSLVSALTDSDWFNCIFTYIGRHCGILDFRP